MIPTEKRQNVFELMWQAVAPPIACCLLIDLSGFVISTPTQNLFGPTELNIYWHLDWFAVPAFIWSVYFILKFLSTNLITHKLLLRYFLLKDVVSVNLLKNVRHKNVYHKKLGNFKFLKLILCI